MESKIQRPKFLTDQEESEWWYANRDLVSEEAVIAFERGVIQQKPLVPPGQEVAAIVLDSRDGEIARTLATKRGVSYETYLRDLLHEAVQRDLNAA